MSKEDDKFKHSKRIHQEESAINKQVKIAKSHSSFNEKNIEQKHRLAKHHAMDCGNPECYLCGNPRKTHKDKLTAQEKRLFQDVDTQTDRKGNGNKSEDQQ